MYKIEKIVIWICMTIAFVSLITLISISNMINGEKIGVDIGAFSLYNAGMITVARIKQRVLKGGE